MRRTAVRAESASVWISIGRRSLGGTDVASRLTTLPILAREYGSVSALFHPTRLQGEFGASSPNTVRLISALITFCRQKGGNEYLQTPYSHAHVAINTRDLTASHPAPPPQPPRPRPIPRAVGKARFYTVADGRGGRYQKTDPHVEII